MHLAYGAAERDARWRSLVDASGAAPQGFPVFATTDLVAAGISPRPWLAHMRAAAVVQSLARGWHLVRPRDAPDAWQPDEREVGWLIGAARYGRDQAYISGLTAASLQRVALRNRSVVQVTVSHQTRRLELPALDAEVQFHQRNEEHYGSDPLIFGFRSLWDAEPGPELDLLPGELCEYAVTSPEQTLLDLWHSPARTGGQLEVRDAVWRLEAMVDRAHITDIAHGQRRLRTLAKAWNMRKS